MNSRLKFPRRTFAAALVASSALVLLASTCKEEIDSRLFALDYVDPNETNTPSGIVSAHIQAWNSRDLGAYSGLLDDGFRFYPLPEEAAEIIWLNGDSWGRETELGIIAHMFDSGWSGQASPVTAVFFETTTLSTVQELNGDAEVTCNLQGNIETGPLEGFQIATRLLFDLDSNSGVLRIRSIREISPTAASRFDDLPPMPVGSSLGSIKAVYR